MARFSAVYSVIVVLVMWSICPVAQSGNAEPPSLVSVEVADVGRSTELVDYLTAKGIPAVIPQKNIWVVDEQANCAVWIGRNVPLATLQVVLPEAIRLNPFLRFFYLVGDRGEKPPEQVHNTIHVGGSNEAALLKKLRVIPQEELLNILGQTKNIEEFHSFLREKNSIHEVKHD